MIAWKRACNEVRRVEIVQEQRMPRRRHRHAVVTQHRGHILGLKNAHPAGPQVKKAEAARFDPEKSEGQPEPEEHDQMRMVSLAQGKAGDAAGRQHGPIRGAIDPCAPGTGLIHHATVQMHRHRRR